MVEFERYKKHTMRSYTRKTEHEQMSESECPDAHDVVPYSNRSWTELSLNATNAHNVIPYKKRDGQVIELECYERS